MDLSVFLRVITPPTRRRAAKKQKTVRAQTELPEIRALGRIKNWRKSPSLFGERISRADFDERECFGEPASTAAPARRTQFV